VGNPFFLLGPHWARIPLVVLATAATVIASQAVISGAYSVSRQAVRLGYLPNLTIRHTSTRESGQIYVPAVNWLLFAGVLVLMLTFRSASRLATAYGMAVTGTFLITTFLFLIVAARVWQWPPWKLALAGAVFGSVELCYFAANLTKLVSGGWLPLVIAALVATVMTTWQAGRRIVTARRLELEGPLQPFVDELRERDLPRVPGTAVFPHPTKETTLALRANVEFNRVLHEHVVVMSVRVRNVPHVPPDERIDIDSLVHTDDGIVHIDASFGFQDEQDVPATLRLAADVSDELRGMDPDNASYFLSRLVIQRGAAGGLAGWRKRLFIGLAHNAANPAERFCLPPDRTVIVGAHLEL
jgi:KUP system potassium uptake protein